jgi:hypothetical protein
MSIFHLSFSGPDDIHHKIRRPASPPIGVQREREKKTSPFEAALKTACYPDIVAGFPLFSTAGAPHEEQK